MYSLAIVLESCKHARSMLDIKPGCQVVDLKRDFAFADNEFDMSLCLGTLTYMEPVARWLFTSLWQSPSKKSKAFLNPGDRGMEKEAYNRSNRDP